MSANDGVYTAYTSLDPATGGLTVAYRTPDGRMHMTGLPPVADQPAPFDAADRVYVLAGNYQQFGQWCSDRKISRYDRRVRYIAGRADLLGAHQGMWYIKVGTWEDRRDIEEIRDVLRTRDARCTIAASWITADPVPRGRR